MWLSYSFYYKRTFNVTAIIMTVAPPSRRHSNGSTQFDVVGRAAHKKFHGLGLDSEAVPSNVPVGELRGREPHLYGLRLPWDK